MAWLDGAKKVIGDVKVRLTFSLSIILYNSVKLVEMMVEILDVGGINKLEILINCPIKFII